MQYPILKLNSSGKFVKQLQELLGIYADGVFGKNTKAAVIEFQLNNNLTADGVVGQKTWNLLLNDSEPEEYPTTDYSETLTNTNYDLIIYDYFLQKNEYFTTHESKEYIFLHHTAGWDNPYNVIDGWEKDTRGKIATEYVIGGINLRTNSTKYDGEVVKAFPNNGWAYHLGLGNTPLHRRSIGIELCNFGYVVKKNNKFYTYTNAIVDTKYVIDLGYNFRGHRYWHSYTRNQILALKELIYYLSDTHDIDIKCGLYEYLSHESDHDAFEFKKDIITNPSPGIYSHTHVNSGKFDVYPHPDLIDMLLKL